VIAAAACGPRTAPGEPSWIERDLSTPTRSGRRAASRRRRRRSIRRGSAELSPRQRQLIEELAQVNGELPGGESPRKRLLDRVLSLLEE